MAEEVEKVILSVYTSGGNENARRDAERQLNEFVGRPEAWGVCLQLLGSNSNHVQFYSSNMLFRKVKTGWQDQPGAVKEDVHGRVLAAIRDYVQNDACKIFIKVLQRLCLVLARITVKTPEALQSYLAEVVSYLQVALGESASVATRRRAFFVCTQLLMDLPEEQRDDAGPSHALVHGLDPDGIDSKLRAAVPDALKVITRIIQHPESAFYERAFTCLERWAPLAIDLPALARFNLLRPLLVVLNSSTDSDTVHAASRALVACVEKDTLEAATGQPESEETLRAFDETVEALLACQPRLADPAPGAPAEADLEPLHLSICKAVMAVADRQVQRIAAGETPQLLQLAQMVLGLTGHRSRTVAVHSLNFWLLVQDIPMAERHESLREPCFFTLLDVLLRQSQLNASASSGSDHDVDYDISSFRDSGDGVKEPFVNISFVLGARFVQCMHEVVVSTSEWPMFEAALFALHAAAGEIVNTICAGTSSGPQGAAIRTAVEALLANLPKLALAATNGATARATARTLGAFARILARMNRDVIESSLDFTISALGHAGHVSRAAAQAFHNICSACRLELAMYPEAVKALAQRVEQANKALHAEGSSSPTATGQGPITMTELMPLEARVEVVKGMTRVASCMKLSQCTEILAMLLNPGISRLTAAVEQQIDRRTVCCELEILRNAVIFSDFKGQVVSAQHPAAGILQATLPILDRVHSVPALRTDSEVVDALYNLISTSFVSAKDVLAPHLESLLQSAIRQFKTTWSPCCVTCVGKAVEIFCVVGADHQSGFVQLFALLTEAMIEAVRDDHVSGNPLVVTEFFATANLFLLFCPAAIFAGEGAGSALDVLLQIATKCLDGEDGPALRSLLHFVMALFQGTVPGEKLEQFRPALDQAFARQGRALVDKSLIGLAHQAPRAEVPRLADLVGMLVASYGGLVQEWAYATLVGSPQLFSALSDTSKEHVVSMVPALHVSSTKAKELFVEVARACRKETADSDLLGFAAQVQESLELIRSANASPGRKDAPVIL